MLNHAKLGGEILEILHTLIKTDSSNKQTKKKIKKYFLDTINKLDLGKYIKLYTQQMKNTDAFEHSWNSYKNKECKGRIQIAQRINILQTLFSDHVTIKLTIFNYSFKILYICKLKKNVTEEFLA